MIRVWLKRWLRRHAVGLSVISLLLLFMLVYAAPSIFVFIEPGYAGALWRRFGGGTDIDTVYGEGTSLKFPWDKMYLYNIRLAEATGEFDVLASDGLAIDVEVTTRYRLIERDVGLLHKHIGPGYVKTLLLPEIESHLREQLSQYRPDQIYTTRRAEVEKAVLQNVSDAMQFKYEPLSGRESFLHVENILIKSIELPVTVKKAIEDKLTQEQLMLGYDYRLQREEKEKQRKIIEAEGIKAFQDIVKEGISEQFLKWKGINATLDLAKSNNSKIVIIGGGEGGLPIILGNVDQPPVMPAPIIPATPENVDAFDAEIPQDQSKNADVSESQSHSESQPHVEQPGLNAGIIDTETPAAELNNPPSNTPLDSEVK